MRISLRNNGKYRFVLNGTALEQIILFECYLSLNLTELIYELKIKLL